MSVCDACLLRRAQKRRIQNDDRFSRLRQRVAKSLLTGDDSHVHSEHSTQCTYHFIPGELSF